MAYQPIENYGMIGDMRSVALVGTNGSIDWRRRSASRTAAANLLGLDPLLERGTRPCARNARRAHGAVPAIG